MNDHTGRWAPARLAFGSEVVDLHVHLPAVVGDWVAHRAPPREPIPHRVTLKPGTKLATIMEEVEFEAASWHHQAIRRIPAQLEATALAPDGVVEAVEMVTHRPVPGSSAYSGIPS